MAVEVSVILPTMNEEDAVKITIPQIRETLERLNLPYEIIVVDKSTDETPKIAAELGAKVIRQKRKGYGDAYLEGFKVARGNYIVMLDPDGSYDPREIPKLLEPLLKGEADFVIGTRLKGVIKPGAMPWLHRYIGNPLLTKVLNIFFKVGVSDAHCGFRAITKDALQKLPLKCRGMEFASEMVIEAAKAGLRIREVPITYHPRIGESKLSSFRDGWRHLRLMLLYSPSYLFLLPGVFLIVFGIVLLAYAYNTNPLRIHTMILGSLLIIVGFQVINFGISGKVYAAKEGLDKPDKITKFFMRYSILEEGLVIGGILFVVGLILGIRIFLKWRATGYGELFEIKSAVIVLTLIALSIQLIFFSFFVSSLMLKEEL
ncbi:dolichol-P-glucose synthetase [Thermococcus litoralis DSM 5473]|uniref:Dolichol-P-glucose synthetase n=1 Tax=Thermococcus litoralis (strain ATCC 51850 / DSM 5473 / JCM 8560 / NS-C) TaxID=523849 RepID=H3ZRA3_THELN|nr:glycosyltransferase [Thermococcus litoralis]EHR77572.1 dolichol-P-glucose synthetase [Thermococcus litoralis DSM 5473]